MAQEINRLTALKVKSLEAPGRHADGAGLYLSIGKSGGRRWVFLYRRDGRITEMGLGSARPGFVTLKQARDKAIEARAALQTGSNPLAAKRRQPKAVPTFGEFSNSTIDDISAGFSNAKHRAQWKATLNTYASSIARKPVSAITTEDVLAILKPIWSEVPETASRVRGRMERVLNAAKAQGLATGDNPARWRGHLDQLLPRRQKLSRGHHAAMKQADLPRFAAQLRNREAESARALEFLILTASRSGEVRGLRWAEIDFEGLVWTIPADRMKSKRPHRVPLTSRMVELLRGQEKERASEFVFPGPTPEKPLSSSVFKILLERMERGDVTPHGFRSTFRDWSAEQTAFPNEVAEMALAHVIKNDTEAAYRRGDLLEKRRVMMEAWEKFTLGS